LRKVGWVASRFAPTSKGGAEETDFALIEQGIKEGFQIERLQEKPKEKLDYIVVSNYHDWLPSRVKQIIEGYKYALFRHDIFQLNNAIELLQDSFVNIFMSPLQYQHYRKLLIFPEKHFMTPCAFTTFDPYHSVEKKNHYVGIGDIVAHKGVYNIFDYAIKHQKDMFYLYGNIYGRYSPPMNVRLMGFIEPEKVSDILAEAKYFIHLPELKDTCPRTVVAAFLSECKLVYNQNIGLFSWPWNWEKLTVESLKKTLTEYKENFWKTLDSYYTGEAE